MSDMLDGSCPKCAGDEVYSNRELMPAPNTFLVYIPRLLHYVCVNCGYTEHYTQRESFDSIRKRWVRVSPREPGES